MIIGVPLSSLIDFSRKAETMFTGHRNTLLSYRSGVEWLYTDPVNASRMSGERSMTCAGRCHRGRVDYSCVRP